MNTAPFSGQSTAKGRNGYYAPAGISTFHIPGDERPFHFDIEGKRSVKTNATAGIRFQLTAPDLDNLIASLQRLRDEANHEDGVSASA